MKHFILFTILFAHIILSAASPLHSKLNHSVIIETDCDNSDLRAIGILLSHSAITVKALVVKGEEHSSARQVMQLKSALALLGADSVPVFYSSYDKDMNRLVDLVRSQKEKLSVVSLGHALVSKLIKNNKSVAAGIEDYIFFCDLMGRELTEKVDELSFIASEGIHFDIVTNLYPTERIVTSESLTGSLSDTLKLAAAFRNISSAGNDKEMKGTELAAIYLVNPELFIMSLFQKRKKINITTGYNLQSVKEVIDDMLQGRYKAGHFVALYGFPLMPELYTYDIRRIMDSAISLYGPDEWKACVMTDEFHGQLGVYSIVGAKMGIRAREYFRVGTDLLEIQSFAGSVEPFSCMNDGLQVSTGATLGQGSIRLINDTIAKSQAIFTCKGASIMISLKPEYKKQLKSVIDKGIEDYGLEDAGYWNLVRQTAIKFWLEWDRNKIFEITEL